MTVNLHRLDQDFHLQAVNDEGLTMEFDGGAAIGGHNLGFRPMQTVLAAVGACSSIDIVLLLRKQRQELADLKIRLEAERREEAPRLFTKIHVHYILSGALDDKKVERACRLSMEKMCSV
ncbi:MAG: OsmC family protein, partial [Bacteroidota bacterium]